MASIESVLRKSRLSDESRIRQCRAIITSRPDAFGQLLDAVVHPDPSVRVAAAKTVNAVTENDPDLTNNYKNILIYKIAKVEQNDVRREIIHVVSRLKLTEREYVDAGHIINDYFYSGDKEIVALCYRTVETLLSREYDTSSPLTKRFIDMLENLKRRYSGFAGVAAGDTRTAPSGSPDERREAALQAARPAQDNRPSPGNRAEGVEIFADDDEDDDGGDYDGRSMPLRS